MSKIIKILSAVFTLLVLVNFSYADENYYDQAIKEFDKKNSLPRFHPTTKHDTFPTNRCPSKYMVNYKSTQAR